MERGPLSTPEFAEFAKSVVLFAHVTSRIPGEKYADLLQEKGGQGFPHLVVMDAEGEVLAEHDGPREVAAFRETTAGAQRYAELRKVANPTPAQKLDLFLAELEMGKLDLATAQTRKAELKGLTPEQEARISTALTDLEVMDVLEKTPQPEPGQEAKVRAELGGRFHAMLQAGKRPSDDQPFQAFWGLMMDWAEQEKNVAAFEQALAAMRERFGKMPQAGPFFRQQDERLARLRQAATAPR